MSLNESINSTHNIRWPQGLEAAIMSATLIIILVISLIGNSIVVWTTIQMKKLHTSTNLLIANLAICDLMISIFIVPMCLVVIQYGRWPYNYQTCQAFGFIEMVCYTVSISLLAAVSINRYYAIVGALSYDYNKNMSIKRAIYKIVFVWIYALAWASPPLFGWNRYTFIMGKLMCNMDHRDEGQYPLFITLFCTVLPSLVILFCTVRIIYTLRRHRSNRLTTLNRGSRFEGRVTMMLGLIALVFVLCVAPNLTVATVVRFNDHPSHEYLYYTIQAITTIIYLSNSAWNAIIYCTMNSYIRLSIKQNLKINLCFLCQCRNYHRSGSVSPVGIKIRTQSVR